MTTALYHCYYCNTPISANLIEDLTQEKEVVLCEICGTELKKETVFSDIQIPEPDITTIPPEERIKKDAQKVLSFKKLTHLFRIFTFRYIYEIIKTPEYSKELRNGDKYLTDPQLKSLSYKLRIHIIQNRFPEDWLMSTGVKKAHIEEFYESTLRILKKKKFYRQKYQPLYYEWFRVVFGLITGTFKSSEFHQKHQLQIINDLKRTFGFISEGDDRNSFLYYITTFATRLIYDYVQQEQPYLEENRNDIETLKQWLYKFADGLTHSVAHHKIPAQWLEETAFTTESRKKFDRLYKRLQEDLRTDNLFYESFIDHMARLIRITLSRQLGIILQLNHNLRTVFSLRKITTRLNSAPQKIVQDITLTSKDKKQTTFKSTLDTGSDVCLINASLVTQLGLPTDSKNAITIKDLNKTQVAADKCSTHTIFEECQGICDFYIFEGLTDIVGTPILIGMDLINGIIDEKGSYIIGSKNSRSFNTPPASNDNDKLVMIAIATRDNILNYVKNTYYQPTIKEWSDEKFTKIIKAVEEQGFTKTPPHRWTPSTRTQIEGMIKAIPLIMDNEEDTRLLQKDIATKCGIGIDLVKRITVILRPDDHDTHFKPAGRKRYNKAARTERKNNIVQDAFEVIDKEQYPSLFDSTQAHKSRKEIHDLTVDLIEHTLLSQRKIVEVLIQLGGNIDYDEYRYEIRDIALNDIYKGDDDLYKERFPDKYQLHETTREDVIKLLKEDPPQALITISETCKVGHGTVSSIAEEIFTVEEYKERWPANQEPIPDEIREEIIKYVKEKYPNSLIKIGNTVGVSPIPVKKLAKMYNTPQEYRKKWPADQDKYPQTLKNEILARMKENPPIPLIDILREFKESGISSIVISTLADQNFSVAEYRKRWTATKYLIPDEVREQIKNDIEHIKRLTATDIAEKYDIVRNTVAKIALEEVYNGNKQAYKERFPQNIHSGRGILTHQKTSETLTAFFNSKGIKLYSEPQFYPYVQLKPDAVLTAIEIVRPNAKRLGIAIPGGIQMIVFDFTNDLTEKNILHKIIKYQHPKIMLFVVGTKWPSWWKRHVREPPKDDAVKFRENTKTISHAALAQLIGLDGKHKAFFEKIIENNKNWDLDSLEEMQITDKRYNSAELKNDFDFTDFFDEKIERKRKRLVANLKKKIA